MTIAIAIKVHDGVVLAADSASSMVAEDAAGAEQVTNVYNNANKIFNIVKGLPIGGLAWGSGSIGPASIATLVKDLRVRLTEVGRDEVNWHLDPASYTIETVANRVKEFFEEQIKAASAQPTGGFLVTGYSKSGRLAESWCIELEKGKVSGPKRYDPEAEDEPYCLVKGEWDPVYRLLFGISSRLKEGLKAKGVKDDELDDWVSTIMGYSSAGLISEAMPIRDAIDLAEFLANVAAQFRRFAPGHSTVGGPIDLAAITKHEGFKWIKRKYYFRRKFNPKDYQ